MDLPLYSNSGSYVQFITVLVIFVLVLAITVVMTKWLANNQKQQNLNIEVVETSRIAPNKLIQIVRVGEKYMVIAVCKDTVTMLGELSKEQLKAPHAEKSFKELLNMAARKSALEESKEKQVHDNQ